MRGIYTVLILFFSERQWTTRVVCDFSDIHAHLNKFFVCAQKIDTVDMATISVDMVLNQDTLQTLLRKEIDPDNSELRFVSHSDTKSY